MIRWSTLEHAPDAHTLVVSFDRADKRNALTPEMLHELATVGARVRNSPAIGCVLLAGEGDVFCAGFDLSLCRNDASAMQTLLRELAHAARALRALPVPVVCAASGAAIAGGCALLAACDFAITDENAKIGYPVVRLGLSPAVSGPVLLPTVGEGPARERLLDPALISGADALRLALATECVPTRADVRPRAEELCESLATKPTHALTATKSWLNELDNSLDMQTHATALEASLNTATTDEFRECLANVWKDAPR